MTLVVSDCPRAIRVALTERGWAENSPISAERAFAEFCEWEGLIGWGPALWAAVEDLKAMEGKK